MGLTGEGRRQSRALFRELPHDHGFDLAASPLRRARETARLIEREGGVEQSWFPPEFRELNQGFWNGLRGDRLGEFRGHRYRRWIDRPLESSPPGGESLRAVRDRVARGLRFLGRRAGARVVLVAHKVVNSLCAHLLGERTLREVMDTLGDNASVLRLERPRRALVEMRGRADRAPARPRGD